MKQRWLEWLAILGERLRGEGGRELVLLGRTPASNGVTPDGIAPEHPFDDGEFEDLLQSLGAEQGPRELEAQLLFKELEVAELQRNLRELRGMGDALADIEQERLAERDELVEQCSRAQEDAARWRAHCDELQRLLDETAPVQAEGERSPAETSEEHAALVRRYSALRARHARLTARWRALPRDERTAADELLALRGQRIEMHREAARLEARGERLERELERRTNQRERDRERLAQARARTDAAREKAREHRLRAQARAAEVRDLREDLRARDERLTALEGVCNALRAELEAWEGAELRERGAPDPGALRLETLDGLRGRLEELLRHSA